ncbi:MAG: PAS domain S-box protein [candidate division WOR-3 bacterium]
MKILVLDDKAENRILLKEILKEKGHNIVEVNNCVDAFKLLLENGFDLIISGILQPVLDGLQFCYRVKTNDKTKDIPMVICVPGVTDEKGQEYLKNLGADAVMNTTMQKEQFAHKLNDFISDIVSGSIQTNRPSLHIDKSVLQTYSAHFLQKLLGISTKYQTLFDSAGDGIMILKDYKFVECNKRALEIFGCDEKDIIGKYPYELSPAFQPDGSNSNEKAIQMMKEALYGKPMFFEWQHRRIDGSLFDTEVSLRRFELPDGVYLLALVRDITEKKRIQGQLKENEELFRTIFESAKDCIFIKNKALRYVMVNKCTAELLGMKTEEIIGKTDFDIFGPDTANTIISEDRRVLNGEVIENFSERNIRGKRFKFHTIKVPLYNAKGEIWGLCGIARDISEQETTKSELIKNQERLQLITENITEVIFILDMDLKFTFMSPSIKIIGYDTDELLNNGVEKLLTRHSYSDAMKVLKEELEIESIPTLNKNRYRSLLLQIKKRDGMEIWAQTTFKFIRDKEGKPIGILGVARDVSDAYNAHQELKKSYEQLNRLLEGAVTALASAVEKRDPYTAGHQRRVAELTCTIAEEMGLSKEIINYLRIASLLHDVGKIYVPAEILAKPTTLTPAEFEIIKTHSQVGYEILAPVNFPWPIPEIVLQHHEKMDGSGYPKGLKGDEIMIEAKILCVADIVEAMMSHRPYREALGLDQALNDISKGRGIKFEPEIVDICIKLFKEKGFRFSK